MSGQMPQHLAKVPVGTASAYIRPMNAGRGGDAEGGDMRRSVFLRAMMVIFFGAASFARADGFRNPPDGATALGRIGGTYVQIDDATAASRNPANLTDLTVWSCTQDQCR